METNLRHRKPRFFTLALFLGIAAIFIPIVLNAGPAYARGQLKVGSPQPLDIQFVSSSTDDQGRSIDPGLDVDVGECTASLDEKRVEVNIYNGYPNYRCTFVVRLKNLSEQAVQLQRVKTKVPETLIITQPDFTDGFTLQPEAEATLEFPLRIHPDSEENAKYRFSIELIFESAATK